jgi:predicted acyltransferase
MSDSTVFSVAAKATEVQSRWGASHGPAGRLEGQLEAEAQARPAAPAPRLVSLDAFRGLAILGMLLVNNVALDQWTPRQLSHAGWNQGITFADLVFPWFLFIVGVSIPFSLASLARKAVPMWRQDLKILARALSLFALGCLVDSVLARRPIFALGVLQLIGLAYLVAAFMGHFPLSRRLGIAGALLLSYWGLLRFFPLPGPGAGTFSPTHNVAEYLDSIVFAPMHLRGLLSVLPTSALVLLGAAAGDLLRSSGLPSAKRLGYLAAGGVGAMALAWLWSLDLPFNKPLWTPPYVLFAAGTGFMLLALLAFFADVLKWRWPVFPLVVLGSNALVGYVAPILTKVWILQDWVWKLPDGSRLPLGTAFLHYSFTTWGRIAGAWIYTGAFLVFWWAVLFLLYRRRIFLRV